MDAKQILQDYQQDQEGENPIAAAFNLLTFTKTIPLQIIKGVGLALLIYIVMNGLLFYFDVSWGLILLSLIGGVIALAFLAVTGTLKFITDAFLESVSGLLLGVLKPVDHLYDTWQEASTENLSRKEFTFKMLQEGILPQALESLGAVPFKKRLGNRLDVFMDNFTKENEQEEEKTSKEDVESEGKDYMGSMIRGIERSVGVSQRGFSKPFWWSVRVAAIAWAIIWLLHLT